MTERPTSEPDWRPEKSLSWRIADDAGEGFRRVRWRTVVLAQLVFAALLIVVAPAWLRAPGFIVLGAAAAITAWRFWRERRTALDRHDAGHNVRLDQDGLYWKSPDGQWRGILRAQIKSFRIGPDALTVRPVSSLTLLLDDGWESQPIELHPPATVSSVRDFLDRQWRLAEEAPVKELLAWRLSEAIAAACQADPPAAEKRALLLALWPRERMAESLSRGGRFRAIGEQIAFDPVTRSFRFDGDEPVEAADIGELLNAIHHRMVNDSNQDLAAVRDEFRRRIDVLTADVLQFAGVLFHETLAEFLAEQLAGDFRLPFLDLQLKVQPLGYGTLSIEGHATDANGRLRYWGEISMNRKTGRVTGTIDASREDDELAAGDRMLDAARRLGFLCEFLPHRHELRIVAPPSRLLRLCVEMEEAATRLAPPPFGARPKMIELGDSDMPLPVGYGAGCIVDGRAIWADAASLDDLAKRMREALKRGDLSGVAVLKISPDPRDRWRLELHVRDEGHLSQRGDLFDE